MGVGECGFSRSEEVDGTPWDGEPVRGSSARRFRSNCNRVSPPPEIFSNTTALDQDREKMR